MSMKKSSQQAVHASVRARMRASRSRNCLCCSCLRCVLLRYQCLHSSISSVTIPFVAFACVAAASVFAVSVDVCMCARAHVLSAMVQPCCSVHGPSKHRIPIKRFSMAMPLQTTHLGMNLGGLRLAV